MSKSVRDLMHPGLITCRPDTALGQVAVMLDHHHVHALFVADRDGRPLGVISDFDLLAAEWLSTDEASLETMKKMTAGELMTHPIDSIEGGVTACDAAARMRSEGISRLMVTHGSVPVGVVSTSDFVASLADVGGFARRTVADVMSHSMLICRDTAPIRGVARGMTAARYRSVIVVSAVGKPLGVVSGQDLLVFCENGKMETATAGDSMHEALTIAPTASLREAADRLIEQHHHRLVVVDPADEGGMPLGVLSAFDIVAEMAHPGSIWRK
jgi:CBS domain-containing protein